MVFTYKMYAMIWKNHDAMSGQVYVWSYFKSYNEPYCMYTFTQWYGTPLFPQRLANPFFLSIYLVKITKFERINFAMPS